MLDYISYILFFSVFAIIFGFIYIRLKFGFWAIQPVFHIYDIKYMINPPGIIDDYLPDKNKYTNFKNIDTSLYVELTQIQKQRLVNLIQANYLQRGDNTFMPRLENIAPYFTGHNDKSFVSFYNEPNFLIDLKKGTTINEQKFIGLMTSRPLHVLINNGDNEAKFQAYYVDYLCVDKLHRKKGIAQQLIQTHHYNQRHINKNIVVSLFKREDELTGIVPLCVYNTYGFPVNTWVKPPDLSAEYKLVEVNPQNFHILYDFIKSKYHKFDIVINTEVTNIVELIKTKNIFINMIIVDDAIVATYMFRKSCVQIEKNMEVLDCFASISNVEDNIFIQGFKISFWKIAAENYFGFCAIEDISDNNILINNIQLKTKPLVISPTAYFFYNFAYPTFKSNKVLIIN
jgi:ribosomal protein S18 acetylase RimI-like enzyme